MWMKCPHPYIIKLHSQANTIIGSLHFSIARGNCSDDGIWQGSSQCGEGTPPGRCHCQLCHTGRCTGCVRLILLQGSLYCEYTPQFKSPFGHLTFCSAPLVLTQILMSSHQSCWCATHEYSCGEMEGREDPPYPPFHHRNTHTTPCFHEMPRCSESSTPAFHVCCLPSCTPCGCIIT